MAMGVLATNGRVVHVIVVRVVVAMGMLVQKLEVSM